MSTNRKRVVIEFSVALLILWMIEFLIYTCYGGSFQPGESLGCFAAIALLACPTLAFLASLWLEDCFWD